MCPVARHYSYTSPLQASLKKDSDMKIDKTTYNYKEKGQIGMTADHTSRPDKVLFFADPHFFVFLPTHNWHIWLCPTHKLTLRKAKRANSLPTHD